MEENTQLRVLWVNPYGDSHYTFRKLSEAVTNRLKTSTASKFDVFQSSWGNVDAVGRGVLRYRPDVIVVLSKLEDVDQFSTEVAAVPVPLILCCSVSGLLLSQAIASHLKVASHLVVFSRSAAETARKIAPESQVAIIPLGVNSKVFRPLDKQLVRSKNRLDGKFIVGCVESNEPETNFNALLAAFKNFSTGKSDVLLYIHTSLLGTGCDIRSLVRDYGLQDACLASESVDAGGHWTDESLAELYNLFDVCVFPSMGSDVDARALESLACGAPVAATDAGALGDLVREYGEPVTVKEWLVAGRYNVRRAVLDTDHLAEVFETLYRSRKRREELALLGRGYAEKAGWDACAKKWVSLIEQVARPSGAIKPAPGFTLRPVTLTSSLLTERRQPILIEPFENVASVPACERKRRLPTVKHRNETLKVAWRSPVMDASGYADESRCFFLALSRRIEHLRLDDTDWMPQKVELSPGEMATLRRTQKRKLSPPFLEIVNNEPELFKRNELAYYRVGRSMFELSSLPEFWMEECNAMDEIWVPSSFCLEMFERSGVSEGKLRLIPEPMNTRAFVSDSRLQRHGGAPVRFLSVGVFIRRKGWEKLLEAYVREFTSADPVELVIRTFRAGMPLATVAEQMLNYIRQSDVRMRKVPPIVLLEEQPLSREQMRDLYRSADVLVAPTKGEGFGRPQLESLACGVPVITTGWGGQTDFVTEENGWLLDYKLCLADPHDNLVFDGKKWAEPDVEHLRQCMREAVEDKELRRNKGAKGPETVDKYDQELIADQVLERLEQIEAEFGPKPTTGKASLKPVTKPWVMMTSPHERCGIREYTRRLMEAGLSEHMTMISAPELFRNFKLDAELIHVQYHAQYINPHQFLHHPPSRKLVATLHDLHRFEEISHLFDAIIVHNSKDYGKVIAMPRKKDAIVEIIPHGCCKPAAEEYVPSGRTDPVIAFHGFAAPVKGLKELVKGFAKFHKSYPSSKLLVVSSFNGFFEAKGRAYMEECKKLANKLGIGRHVEYEVEFLPIDEVIALLHEKADMTVLPYLNSDDSGTSGAIRTAMASARPVIATDIPLFYDLREEVVKFPVEQISKIQEVLQAVWGNQAVRRRIVNQALQTVRSDSWEYAAGQISQITLYLTDSG